MLRSQYQQVDHRDQARPRRRILLIDDDPDAALFATYVLTTRGHFDVTHAAGAAAGLRAAATERWDLVLTEVEVRGLTGTELLQGLRQLTPALPIVVLTAHMPPEATAAELRGHADAFLTKPVRIDCLVTTVIALTG
jgi:DNA-binding response OmpR family regulator